MKQRAKPIVIVVLLAVASAALTMSLGLFKAVAAQAATCDVPSGTNPTIQSAVNDINCDTINLTAELYEEFIDIDRSVTIQGKGSTNIYQSDNTRIDGNYGGRVFTIHPGHSVTIKKLIIVSGSALTGGGIYNDNSALTLNEVTIAVNQATGTNIGGGGGGIYNSNGELYIYNSRIFNNHASRGGAISSIGPIFITNSELSINSAGTGGAISSSGPISIISGTFSYNRAGSGGAISSSGSLSIANSFFDNNSASSDLGIKLESIVTFSGVNLSVISDIGRGGAIHGSGAISITNSTLSNNSAESIGGAIYISGADTASISSATFSENSAGSGGGVAGPASIANTIIVNSQSGGACDGPIKSLGYNLDSDGTCNLTATGDWPNTNPQLRPLRDFPGYYPLRIGSPAINGGNPDGCTDHLGNLLSTDQLGQPRVGRCDIGAYEYQGVVHTASLPLAYRDYCIDFIDDFSNPTSGWDVVDNDFVLAEYLNGEYRILSRNSDFFYPFPSPSCERENYVVETDARWVGTPGSSYGLVFGINSSFDDFYLFDMNTDFQMFRLLRFYPGGVDTIIPITASPAINDGNATNHLKVTRDGAQIILEINGTVLGTWSDSKITGLTSAGLMSDPYSDSSTTDARFDNFSLTGLPSSATAQITDSSTRATSQSDMQIENRFAAPIGAPWWYLKD